MGSMNYARFPNGVSTQRPTLSNYVLAISALEVELLLAREEDGRSMRTIRLRADLAAWRQVIRRIRWRHSAGW